MNFLAIGQRLRSAAGRPSVAESGRVFYVFALPKSASRNMYRTLLAMQPEDQRIELITPPVPRINSTGYMVNAEVKPYFLEQNPSGLLHSHAGPLPVTMRVLITYGVRHIVMVRHPADHLAALYCHLRRLRLAGSDNEDPPPPERTSSPERIADIRSKPPRWHSVIHPVHGSLIGGDVSIGDSLDHMIRDGYLAAALTWLTNWRRFADPELTRIVRYEDLVGDPITVTADIYRHLWQAEPARLIDPLAGKPDAPPAIYPCGTTAEPEAWRQYFTPRNVAAYNDLVRRWNSLHGDALRGLYGTLEVHAANASIS